MGEPQRVLQNGLKALGGGFVFLCGGEGLGAGVQSCVEVDSGCQRSMSANPLQIVILTIVFVLLQIPPLPQEVFLKLCCFFWLRGSVTWSHAEKGLAEPNAR